MNTKDFIVGFPLRHLTSCCLAGRLHRRFCCTLQSAGVLVKCSNKKRKTSQELINLGLNSVPLDTPRLRASCPKPNRTVDTSASSDRKRSKNNDNKINGNKISDNKDSDDRIVCKKDNGDAIEAIEIDDTNKSTSNASSTKRWVRLTFDDVDPQKFIGLACKVYWLLDADWYFGRIAKYDSDNQCHHVEYEDCEDEWLNLSKERIKFNVSPDEIKSLELTCDKDFKQLICQDVQLVMPLPDLKRWSFYTLNHYMAQYKCDPLSDLSLRVS